jgi:hypothetical protein
MADSAAERASTTKALENDDLSSDEDLSSDDREKLQTEASKEEYTANIKAKEAEAAKLNLRALKLKEKAIMTESAANKNIGIKTRDDIDKDKFAIDIAKYNAEQAEKAAAEAKAAAEKAAAEKAAATETKAAAERTATERDDEEQIDESKQLLKYFGEKNYTPIKKDLDSNLIEQIEVDPIGIIINAPESTRLDIGDLIISYQVNGDEDSHIFIDIKDIIDTIEKLNSNTITFFGARGIDKKKTAEIAELTRLINNAREANKKLDNSTSSPTGNKNASIENAIGAIILALALTISESNPGTNTKKEIGANTIIKKLTDEQITKLKTKHYDPLIKEIAEKISPQRSKYQKEFNAIKTATGNKNSKKEGLIKVLNNLLTNKRAVELIKSPNYAELVSSIDVKPDAASTSTSTSTSTMSGGHGFYDPNDTQTKVTSEFYNSQNGEIEEHRRLINEIMNYLLEQKINIRYQWVAIKESGTKKLFQGKVGIISKLNNDNTNDIANKGKWSFTVWVPDKGGLQVMFRPNKDELKTKLQIKDSTGAVVDKFHTTNISIYDLEFLGKAYDPKNDVNILPLIEDANFDTISSLKNRGSRQVLNKALNVMGSRSATDIAQGTYTNAEGIATSLGTRGLRQDLKELIKDVIESKFTAKDDIELLKIIITFYNKKKSIKDILISKISYIFASGETRLNLFNRKNLAKKFKSDDEEEGDVKPEGDDEPEGDAELDDEEGDDESKRATTNGATTKDATTKDATKKGATKKGATKKGANRTVGGGYGFRNFDKNDAYNIIRLILDSLRELAYKGIPASSRDLLFSTYLKKFLKITPSELNKILQDFTRVRLLSINVIKHYIKRLNGNEEAKEEEDGSPAAVISKLNFALKNNVQSFIGSIVYITLHTEQMVGSKAKIEYYLDNEYNKAMKLPTEEEQSRIDNFQLKKALDEIFGENNSIKDYRNKLKTIDSYIDTMNEKNIEPKLQDFHTVFELGKLSEGTIIYRLPGNIGANVREKAEGKKEAAAAEVTATKKLDQAKNLITELLENYPQSVAIARPTGAEGAEGTGTTETTGTASTAETAKHAQLKTKLEQFIAALGSPPS